jgi:hypothetical protein
MKECTLWVYQADNPEKLNQSKGLLAILCKDHDVMLDFVTTEEFERQYKVVQQVIDQHTRKYKDENG